jgi:acyl carrier protein
MRPDTAEIVHDVWCEVLQIDKVEETDDFFDIGGHSLSAMQVASSLRAKLDGIRVPTRLLFTNRTLKAFTDAVNERLEQVMPA